jgi:hypothetical protein
VHARADAYSDGRMGFGAEIEMYIEPNKAEPTRTQTPVVAPAKPRV